MNEEVDKYLKEIQLTSIGQMSDEQIMDFFVKGYGGKDSKWSALVALTAVKNNELKIVDVVKSMKKAIADNTIFKCCYIENESARGIESLPSESGWILSPR